LGTLLSLKVVGDGKVEDWAQEGFLVASHEEAVEEGADLGVNGISFGVQPVEPVDHSKNEAEWVTHEELVIVMMKKWGSA
jgi:hypothetical protein